MPVLPQFPLGSVLFPTMVLPLHVFELRYRKLIRDVLEDDQLFGVVLIERGPEVGGNDVRTDFGTAAQIVQAEQFVDGRWNVIAVGTRRFRVEQWLDDAPYPQAEVTFVDEPVNADLDTATTETQLSSWLSIPSPGYDHSEEQFDQIVTKFCRLMALASESGVDVGSVPSEMGDPCIASYQMASLAPIAMIDKHRLLSEPSTNKRLSLLNSHFDEAMELMLFRLSTDPNTSE